MQVLRKPSIGMNLTWRFERIEEHQQRPVAGQLAFFRSPVNLFYITTTETPTAFEILLLHKTRAIQN